MECDNYSLVIGYLKKTSPRIFQTQVQITGFVTCTPYKLKSDAGANIWSCYLFPLLIKNKMSI